MLTLMNAIRQIPLIAIGDISQSIDAETATVQNKVIQLLPPGTVRIGMGVAAVHKAIANVAGMNVAFVIL